MNSAITEIDKDIIISKINEVHIIKIEGEKISFTSTSHANYISRVLRANKIKTEKLLIKYYASNKNIENDYQLSKLYSKQKKWREVSDLINERFIEGTINHTESIERVNETIDLGFESSENMKSYADSYKFSIQGSIINELDNYQFWESEIMARISLNDFAGAINLAEKAVLKVDRLKLLSLIAKKEKQINNHVDEELIKLINVLYSNTNLNGSGESLYDIVSNLIYAIPNLAIEIIEKSSGDSSESDINDWIVAKLSAAAINSSANENEKDDEDKKLKAVQKLNNPSVKKIQTAISFMVGNYSSKKVLEEVKKLNDDNEKIKLLRLWLKNNRKYKHNLSLVLEIAFELIIKSSNNSNSTLEALKDLSYQLRNIKENEVLKEVVEKFNQLISSLKNETSKRDYFTLMLNIFFAEDRLRKDKSLYILDELVDKIDLIEDSIIKLECYCEVLQKLTLIKNFKYKSYYNKVYGKVKHGLIDVLNNSANHHKILKNSIEIISKVNPDLGLKLCSKLNTSFSRDRGRIYLLDSYLDNSIKNIKINNLKSILDSFEYHATNELALLNILERYSNSKTLPSIVVKEMIYFINKIDDKEFGSHKLSYLLPAYSIVSKNKQWENRLGTKIQSNITNSWSVVGSEWDRIDVGFSIAAETYEIDSTYAKHIFEKTIEFKKTAWLDSNSVANTYLNCLRLLVRSFTSLVKNELYKKEDISKITNLINRVSSELDKLQLWTELSFNAISSDQADLAKTFYENHILPIVIANVDENYKLNKIEDSLVIIHFFNSQLANEIIEKLPLHNRESICISISDFYLTNKSPFEFYEGDILSNDTSYDNIYKAVDLLKLSITDNSIFSQVSSIYEEVVDNKSLSNEQKIEIANRLDKYVQEKLPDPNNILHNGYKIVCIAFIEKIKNNIYDWTILLEETKNILNVSDRLFINSILINLIPFNKIKNSEFSKNFLYYCIVEDLNNLNSHHEYIDRLLSMSKTMYSVNRSDWKKVISKAFKNSYDLEEGIEMYRYQKDILEKMYVLDEDFAKTLINENKDPDKYLKNQKLIKEYMDMLEISRKIKNNLTIDDIKKADHQAVINALFKALGSLNSGKISTKKISDVSKYLQIGKSVPLGDSLPIYMFFLANSANIKLTKKKESEITKVQRNTFENMIKTTNIIEILSQKRRFNEDSQKKVFVDDDFVNNLIVPPGTKEEALSFIREWMIDEVKDYLIICDPYFSKNDLDILKIVKEVDSKFDIYILGSKGGDDPQIIENYKQHWKTISDEMPPYTDLTFCWIADSKTQPIHDRWIISKNGGLRLGTSFSGLGKKRESEISVIRPNEAFNILNETLDEYLNKKKRYLNAQRVNYSSFTL